MKRSSAFWCACFALLAAARMCHVRVLWADEAYGLAGARRVMEGAALYREVWFDKPPLYAWINLLWGAQTGWLLRLGGALFALLCCWLAARAAASLFGKREGYFAAAAMAFFLTFDHPVAIVSLAPDFLLLPFTLAAVWALAAGRPALAGACAAAGLLANSKALYLLPLIVAWSPRAWARILAGFAAASAAVWLLARGWTEPVWTWGLMYARDTFVARPLREGLLRTANWSGFHAALLIGAALFFARPNPHRWRMVFWLAVSLAAVAGGLRFFPRYYLALLPPLCLIAARGLAGERRRWMMAAAALALVVPAVRFGSRHAAVALERPQAMRDLALFEDCRRAALLLGSMAPPGGTLLVWGYRPELNVLAAMPGAAPFLDSQPLTGVLADRHLTSSAATAPALAAQNRMRLVSTRPDFIADGLGPLNPALAISAFPDLAAWLADYEPVARTRGTLIYRRRFASGVR